jgi:hypothetical protein
MTRRWSGVLIAGMVALTALVLVADSIVSLTSGAYLNLGSGVWLALARDTHDGVFYRPLWNGAEYGGTRYFPVLFVSVAALMRAGMAAVPAGVAVSMLALVALAVSVVMLLKRLGAPISLVALGSALAIAPYFVHQTAFAIRCEPLAAAFAIFGLAVVAPLDARTESNWRLVLAATLFVCAFMTKVTCLYGPAAATLALVFAGRRTAAIKLAAATTAGGVLFIAVLHLLSGGRAIESFRACALAGSSASSLLTPLAITRLLTLIATSHLLTVVFMLSAAALIVSRRALFRLPVLYLGAATAITAIIFTSPGTIITSQIVDAYVAAIVVLTTITAAETGRLRTAGYVSLVALTAWAGAQNITRVVRMSSEAMTRSGPADRRALMAAMSECGSTALSESPLLPILAGHRPLLLDPFAFRVVALNRPDIGHDLVERLRRREFACVVLEQDPSTPRGQAWYTNVNLTGAAMDAVLQHYVLARVVAGEHFYKPSK